MKEWEKAVRFLASLKRDVLERKLEIAGCGYIAVCSHIDSIINEILKGVTEKVSLVSANYYAEVKIKDLRTKLDEAEKEIDEYRKRFGALPAEEE